MRGAYADGRGRARPGPVRDLIAACTARYAAVLVECAGGALEDGHLHERLIRAASSAGAEMVRGHRLVDK